MATQQLVCAEARTRARLCVGGGGGAGVKLSSRTHHISSPTSVSGRVLTRLACNHATQSSRSVPGGSAANVLKGLANLSAGRVRCRFVGMVGTDTAAAEYEEMLRQQGVEPMLLVSSAHALKTEQNKHIKIITYTHTHTYK